MSWRPWKRKPSDRGSNGKLLIPLPIPHPVHIAIAIHNRDTEQPIQLDSELCWDILRSIEDCQGDVEVSLPKTNKFLWSCYKSNFLFDHFQAANIVSRYRGGAADSSLDSLDSTSNESQSQISSGTRGSVEEVANGTETLPCGNREVSTTVTQSNQEQTPGFHWTLSNLQTARRNNTGTVRVDLASPEDISLDTDSSRVVFSAYGTTV